MACFLLLLVIAATVITAPPGKHLTHAARTTSPEVFWRAALPDAPMPESIRELLRPRSEANSPNVDDDANVHDGDDPPPPMNFNYDDYKSSPSPRHQVATAANALEHAGGDRNAATDEEDETTGNESPMVFFLEDAVRVGGSLPFPRRRGLPRNDETAAQPPLELYTVRAVRAIEGSSFVVCRGEGAGGAAAVYGCRGIVDPASAYVADVVGERGDAVTATVVCRADTSNDLEHAAALRLLDVKAGDGGAAVCYVVHDAHLLLVKSEKVPSSAY